MDRTKPLPITAASVPSYSDGVLYATAGELRVLQAMAYVTRDAESYKLRAAQLAVVAPELASRVHGHALNIEDVEQDEVSGFDRRVRQHARRLAREIGLPSDDNRQVWTDHVMTDVVSNAALECAGDVAASYAEAIRSGGTPNIVDLLGVGEVAEDVALKTVVRWQATYDNALAARSRAILTGTQAQPVEKWLGPDWQESYASRVRAERHASDFDRVSASDPSAEPPPRFRETAREVMIRDYSEPHLGAQAFIENGGLSVVPDAVDCPELVGYLFRAEGAKLSTEAALERAKQGVLPQKPAGGHPSRVTLEEIADGVRRHVIEPALEAADAVRQLGITRELDDLTLEELTAREREAAQSSVDASTREDPAAGDIRPEESRRNPEAGRRHIRPVRRGVGTLRQTSAARRSHIRPPSILAGQEQDSAARPGAEDAAALDPSPTITPETPMTDRPSTSERGPDSGLTM